MIGTILWLVVLGLAGVLEFVGRKSGDAWPTLTDLIRKWVPKTIIAAALVWLAYHFGVQSA